MTEPMIFTQYLVERYKDGKIRLLIRFRGTANGRIAEILAGGKWVFSNTVLHKVYEGDAEDITEEEAARIAPLFGGNLNCF